MARIAGLGKEERCSIQLHHDACSLTWFELETGEAGELMNQQLTAGVSPTLDSTLGKEDETNALFVGGSDCRWLHKVVMLKLGVTNICTALNECESAMISA